MPKFESRTHRGRASSWEVGWTAFAATVRSLLRARWFTLGAVLTITVAIVLNIAVLSVVDRMLFRPLPYRDADRLVHLHRAVVRTPAPGAVIDQVALTALRERATTFEEFASALGGGRSEVIDGLGETPVQLASSSPNLLRVLGIRPVLGRDFTDADLQAEERVLLLSYDVWRTRLGSARDVAGRMFEAYRIVGVLPPGFLLPSSVLAERVDGLLAWDSTMSHLPPRPGMLVGAVIARLRPGVTVPQAQAETDVITRDIPRPAGPFGSTGIQVQPMRAGLFFLYRPYLVLIFGAVSIVLLVAGVNLATLLVARGRSREQEIAVHAALGASRRRLIVTTLFESLVVCTTSCVLALGLAYWGHGALLTVVPPSFRGLTESPLDPRLVLIAFGGTIVVAMLAAIIPSWRSSRVDLQSALQRAGRGARTSRLAGGATLLALEAALGLVLVAGGAATVRNFLGLRLKEPGFVSADLYTVDVGHRWSSDMRADQVARPRAVIEAIRSAPGVQSAAVALLLPTLNFPGYHEFWKPYGVQGTRWAVGDGFFETLQTPIRAGRGFTATDVDSRALVAVVNETGARVLFPDRPAPASVGETITTLDGVRQIVGVVADIRRLPGVAPAPALFLPITAAETPPRQSSLMVALRMPAGRLPDRHLLDTRLNERFPKDSVDIESLDDARAPHFHQPRFQAVLFGSLAVAGLLLAAIGLFAVASFEASNRRFEMGVRLTLGATRQQVQRLIVGAALRPVALGAVAGLGVCWWAAKFLQGFLFEVDARDPLTYALVASLLLVTAAIASWWPARSAANVDPSTSLRAN
jgi:predicted permease